MELKVGDIVEFKKYEDMADYERAEIGNNFPEFGKVRKVIVDNEKYIYFSIEGSSYGFSAKSIARVIGHEDNIDISSLNKGDEVLVKVTVKKVFDGFIQINSSVGRTDIVKILKHEELECFIVKENYYGMYIGVGLKLVSNKDAAQVYASRDAAYQEATDMHLNAYDVIPYGN